MVKNIEHPSGSAIIAFYDEDKLEIPNPETKINVGDKVLILAKTEITEKVRELFS